jgi:hypothetical protein
MFPVEIWEMIAQNASLLALFALMQTSRQLCDVVSPIYAARICAIVRTGIQSSLRCPDELNHLVTAPSAFRALHAANDILGHEPGHSGVYAANIAKLCELVWLTSRPAARQLTLSARADPEKLRHSADACAAGDGRRNNGARTAGRW